METQDKIIRGYIYKITNIANGMCYIGKTTYNNIQRRFAQHKSYALVAKGGTEKTVHQAIRDFGIENFKIEKIETVKAPDFLEERERYWIAYYHSWIGDSECNGYNQSKGGEGTHYSSTEFSDYLSDKIISLYEKVQNQQEVSRQLKIDPKTVRNYLYLNNIAVLSVKEVAIKETGKKVAIYKDNILIAIYPSLGDAARHFVDKESASHISEVCYGKRKWIKGYTAKFTDEDIFNSDYMILTTNEFINNSKSNKKKPILMIDIQTNTILKEFKSGCEVGRYFNMDRPQSATTCISRAIQRNGTWRGYKWERKE